MHTPEQPIVSDLDKRSIFPSDVRVKSFLDLSSLCRAKEK
jgi:hypothetical protein